MVGALLGLAIAGGILVVADPTRLLLGNCVVFSVDVSAPVIAYFAWVSKER